MCGSNRLHGFKAIAHDAEDASLVNILECKDCAFAWQYPLSRTEEKSSQYFQAAYMDGGQTQSSYFDENRKIEIAKLELEFISTLSVSNRSLLDIGAGAGIFAKVAAENNWEVTAVDPALDLSRFDNHPSVNAIKGKIAQIPEGKLFDVVTLWDVIEHATNPVELINSAKSHLKEGGWLVLETGNYKSADRVSGGRRHWIYQQDHRWYFSPQSLKRLLAESGLSNSIICEKVLRPGWIGSISYAGPSKINLLKAIAKKPLRMKEHVSKYRALSQVKAWEMPGIGIFTIAARKPIEGP